MYFCLFKPCYTTLSSPGCVPLGYFDNLEMPTNLGITNKTINAHHKKERANRKEFYLIFSSAMNFISLVRYKSTRSATFISPFFLTSIIWNLWWFMSLRGKLKCQSWSIIYMASTDNRPEPRGFLFITANISPLWFTIGHVHNKFGFALLSRIYILCV